ncbi:hypothetical protein OMAG_002070 [Candidatus Omnitrophus magneticus]|uniref:Uncharacterized protein n=1 Tax=Candidatus Omnitrophus magneticus TaxID=1609969 RepID=A0A0F0CRC9_9BACT|nr:hypothetical protein OMAG_002070 [Candidatus Omnitrophus magneticus]
MIILPASIISQAFFLLAVIVKKNNKYHETIFIISHSQFLTQL